jgi:NAD+ diphosphatase
VATWALSWDGASELDRVDHHRRNDEWVAQMWRAPDALLLKLDNESRFTTNNGGTKLRLVKPFIEYDNQRHRLLGLLQGAPIFAVETGTDGELHDLREVGARLTDNERDIAAAATAITQWHRRDSRCGKCGGQTDAFNGGFARRCRDCGTEHFPRTDPAVIVGVIDDKDRILLGGQPHWGNRISVLAGFVEVGESLEQAIHREIAEEADINLSDTHYFGSQPWPFPRSLMVGFYARAVTTNICVDADELEHAAWYTRDELRRQLDADDVGLPGPSSIAYRLIRTWLEGEAPL